MSRNLKYSNSVCFWKYANRVRNGASAEQINAVNSACGASNVAEMWLGFFGQLYSSVQDVYTKSNTANKLERLFNECDIISSDEIKSALNVQI